MSDFDDGDYFPEYSDEEYALYGNVLDQGVSPDDYGVLQDEYGDVIAEGTFADFYEDTLMDPEEFAEAFGEDYTIADFIHDIEDLFEIEWDWDTWREYYE